MVWFYLLFQIGSDGMNSSVRKAAQFHTVNFSYNQKAVVAVLNILGVR
jgi:2-polyprenyl-6-methoxyphenol hydroxylase-like FAD-dependent oxidoreductase